MTILTRTGEDWDDLTDLVEINPGPHTLRIVIDPDDQIAEQNEDDKEFEKVFDWSSEKQPESPPTVYTEQELRSMMSVRSSQSSPVLVSTVNDGHDGTYPNGGSPVDHDGPSVEKRSQVGQHGA